MQRIAFAVLLIAGILATSSFTVQSANATPPDPCRGYTAGQDDW